MRKHKHNWRYHSSQYNEPIKDRSGTLKDIERAKWGFTNVTYVCGHEGCTEVRIESHLGRVSDPFAGGAYEPRKGLPSEEALGPQ